MNNNIIGTILIDRYRVDNYLAEGGMQKVYLATDLSLERQVIIKTPKNSSADRRFKRSAVVSSRVNHKNVAKTLDYIEHTDRDFLVEEYIKGENLSEFLKRFNLIDPHYCAYIMHMVSKGLCAAHHRDIVHRDLKPSNIMVSGEFYLTEVKITDFGIAKLAEESMADDIEGGDETITGSQTIIGALPYMAPEMILEPRNATKKADIWSYGAILYHLLTGERPFGSGLAAVGPITSRNGAPKIPDSALCLGSNFKVLTNNIFEIITACLSPNPDERPDADELFNNFSKICYSRKERITGTIKNFKHGTGNWGFIKRPLEEDSFFHSDSFFGANPEAGKKVIYTPFPGNPQSRAFPVLPLKKPIN